MDVIMPQLGESVEEGTIAQWHKKPGDSVAIDEILLEIETDKVATEVPSLVAGVMKDILVAEGETAKVGTVLCVISTASDEKATGDDKSAGDEKSASSAGAKADTAKTESAKAPSRVKAPLPKTAPDGTPLSPAVRRLIAHHDLDPAAITGTGRDGRIQRNDVMKHLDRAGPKAATPMPGAFPPVKPSGRDVERQPFSSLRRKIAQNMIQSKNTSAHVLQAVEADFSGVERVRSFMKGAWRSAEGASLTYLPFIARALCLALPDYPDLNAERDGDSLLRHRHIDMAFAIDLDHKGLMAPVLRNADALKVPALARGIMDLADRARSNTLTANELSGAGYTITNNGSFGTLITAPIINQPQVAILSTDGIKKRPVVVEGSNGDEIAIRPIGVLAQSFDHCVIDGAYSGAFLNRVKEIIETRDWAAEFI
ncbi:MULTISPECIES: dihydrolipoamide acetyltransferase family protein [unclassified Iodidimonas]|jgi:2-oxoglutarate dehydrogenase E2 component (dihydrolipoamide succinyltransferase)|uniref:dihydrolipoamide acetyltransferase family protein n=1 Tax=unclassified Iodidimonas TaxID=2626145 RepID=UPI00248234EE|nr:MULTISPECIES: dihydrolipoamide acetyltransferase family protein [unclassified Iodidimonas]